MGCIKAANSKRKVIQFIKCRKECAAHGVGLPFKKEVTDMYKQENYSL